MNINGGIKGPSGYYKMLLIKNVCHFIANRYWANQSVLCFFLCLRLIWYNRSGIYFGNPDNRLSFWLISHTLSFLKHNVQYLNWLFYDQTCMTKQMADQSVWQSASCYRRHKAINFFNTFNFKPSLLYTACS